jgi:hypothetical protein
MVASLPATATYCHFGVLCTIEANKSFNEADHSRALIWAAVGGQ